MHRYDVLLRPTLTAALLIAASTTCLAQSLSGGPLITALQVVPKSMTGGTTVTLTVTLDRPAQALTGTVVNLAWSNTGGSLSSVPKTVTVPAGQLAYALRLATVPTTTTTTVNVGATLAGSNAIASFTVRRPQVVAVGAPSSLTGGKGACVTIQLDGPAPAGGLPLSLTHSSSIIRYPEWGLRLDPSNPVATPDCYAPGANVAEGRDSMTFAMVATPVTDALSVITTASVGAPLSVTTLVLPPAVTPVFRAGGCYGDPVTAIQGPANVGLYLETWDPMPAASLPVRLGWTNPPPGAPTSVTVATVSQSRVDCQAYDVSGCSNIAFPQPSRTGAACVNLAFPAVTSKVATIVTAGATGAPRPRATLSNRPPDG
jgi:hypothetical protein